MSSFASLNMALNGLRAQQRGLDVSGQNVANANTDGYVRQRVVMEASGASVIPAMWAVSNKVGNGVVVTDVQRLRDFFLESRAHTEHGRSALLNRQQGVLANIETSFGEPGERGLQAQLAEFWGSWGDVANHPGDTSVRAQMLQRAATLADNFSQASVALGAQWDELRTQVSVTVDSINTTAQDVADLNSAIQRATQAKLPYNELADRRDALNLKLADLAGATVKQGDDGMLNVFIGGMALVRGNTVQRLHLDGAAHMADLDTAPLSVTWEKPDGTAGYPAALETGQLTGEREALTSTIPGVSGRLDTVAAGIVTRVNALQQSGYDLDGNPGMPVFAGTGARTFQAVLTDPRKVAATSRAGGGLGNDIASTIAGFATAVDGPDAEYQRLVVDLGVSAEAVNNRVAIQDKIAAGVDAARESDSGVNLDEEMVNLLAYQRAYEGAARVMTAIDEALDTLINRTGTVGR